MHKPLMILFVILTFSYSNGQGIEKMEADTCSQKDISDLIRNALNKPPKVVVETSGSLILLPVIGSNPATGFMIGVGGQYAFKMPETNRYSLISGSLQYTTKNQLIFMLKNTVFSKRNRFFHSGDWRYMDYSQATYGLGTNAPVGGVLDYQYSLSGLETSTDSLAQPMDFKFIRLHQMIGFKISTDMYLGVGYQLDSYFQIKDQKLKLEPGDSIITSHYFYNTLYGFDTKKYFNSALSARFVIDKRDNMISAYRGYYLSVGWRGAFKFIGNENNNNALQVEWRSFHGLSKTNPTHLVGFWLLGDFSEKGTLPYMILPATAYDQRGRSARGYSQGRYRGNSMVYGEVEYRFPISQCSKVLGGVLFANMTTTTNQGLDLTLFESIKPGYGAGLRVMLEKRSRTNLAIDFGFGDKTSGFYLAASETF